MDTSFVQAGILTGFNLSKRADFRKRPLIPLACEHSRLAASEVSPGETPQAKRPWRLGAGRDGCFRRLLCLIVENIRL